MAGAILSSLTGGFPDEWKRSLGDLPLEARLAYADAVHVLFRWICGTSVLACLVTLSVPAHELEQ